MVKNKKIQLIQTILIGLFCLLFGIGGVSSSFYGNLNMIDEGQFAAWANHMLLGKFLFKDIYLVYGPLFVYPLYILYKLFSPTIFILRLYLTFGGFLGIIAIRLLCSQLKFSWKMITTVTLFLILLPGINLRQAMAMFTIYFFLRAEDTKKIVWDFLCGVGVILAFLISQEVGIVIAFLITSAFICKFILEEELHPIIKRITFLATGIVIISLPFFYWVNVEGWFNEYLHMTIDVLNSFSGVDVPNGQNFPNLLVMVTNAKNAFSVIKIIFSKEGLLYWTIAFYLCSFFYFFLRFFLKSITKQDKYMLLIFLYGLLLNRTLLSRSGISHFFFSLHPVFILGVFFFKKIYTTYHKSNDVGGKLVSLFLMSILLFLSFRLLWLNWPNIFAFRSILTQIVSVHDNIPRLGYIAIPKDQAQYIITYQDFIRKNTVNRDAIFFFNDEPMLYMLIDRINPTHYDLPFAALTLEKRLQLVNDLTKLKPKYIFESTSVWAVDDVPNIRRLPEVVQFINQHYRMFLLNNTIRVYELKK